MPKKLWSLALVFVMLEFWLIVDIVFAHEGPENIDMLALILIWRKICLTLQLDVVNSGGPRQTLMCSAGKMIYRHTYVM
jgi:hypothetical protein